jgi:hypothetical protein
MMYPKNAASPEPIAIGAVVQISDGAVQTSGCTVRIKPIGVAEGDGAGTTAYSTDGIVLYTPTQAETNYTSFILIAKKTGCIPVSITVVTTSSATPGTVNVKLINDSATAATRLDRSARTITLGTVGSASTTTAVVASSLDPSSIENDQWNGKIISFANDTTTTALRGQSCVITDYVHSTLTFTVSTLSEAPVSGDIFTIT